MTSTPTPANERGRRRRRQAIAAVALVLAAGFALTLALLDDTPATNPAPDTPAAMPTTPRHTFSIRVRWPGASAEEVDQLIAAPVSASLSAFADIDTVETISRAGEAVTIVTLVPTIRTPAIELTRNGAVQRIAPRLPAEAEVVSLRGDVTAPPDHLVVLTSDRHAPSELREVADWSARPRVLALPGVTDVAVLGVAPDEVVVEVDPRRLAAYGLAVDVVVAALREAAAEVPGGFIKAGGSEVLVRGVGAAAGVEELGQLTLRAGADGVPVRLADVARISLAAGPGGVLRLDGRPAAGLAVHAASEVPDQAIVTAVEAALPPDVRVGWRAWSPPGNGAPPGLHVALRLPPGAKPGALDRALGEVEAAAMGLAGGESVLAWTEGPSGATLLLRGAWPDRAAVEQAARTLAKRLAALPGRETRVALLGASGFSPEPAPVVVQVTADADANALAAAADAVKGALAEVAGVRSSWSSRSQHVDRVVRPDREAAARLGVPLAALVQATTLAEVGLVVSELRDGPRRRAIRVTVPADGRDAVTVSGADGAQIPLRSLIHVEEALAPATIERLGRRLRMTLSAEVADRPVAAVRTDVAARLRALSLPAGTQARLEGPTP